MTNKTPAVSVIVPLYNVEQFLERCLHSLFGQTLGEIEYIFVDDCSPDASLTVLEKTVAQYPSRQTQIKVVRHPVNRGLPAARNSGLELATGKYIIHCDSDDWTETDMLEKLYRKAVEDAADIVWCDYFRETSAGTVRRGEDIGNTPFEAIRHMFSGTGGGYVWNKLVKRGLYECYGIRFPDGVNMLEDLTTTAKLCYHARRISHLPAALYHYNCANPAALTRATGIEQIRKKMAEIVVNVRNMTDFFEQEQTLSEFEKEMNYFKLSIKGELLSHKETLREWATTFPESHGEIFSHPQLGLQSKIYWWLLAHRCRWVYHIKQALKAL